MTDHIRLQGIANKQHLRRKHVQLYRDHSDGDHEPPILQNLAKDMIPDGPNQFWLADITYVAITIGFLYVAVILDAWSRKVVGHAIGRSINVRLTLAALRSAVDRRSPPTSLPTFRASSIGSTTPVDPALRARRLNRQQFRGSTRPAHGQNRSLICPHAGRTPLLRQN